MRRWEQTWLRVAVVGVIYAYAAVVSAQQDAADAPAPEVAPAALEPTTPAPATPASATSTTHVASASARKPLSAAIAVEPGATCLQQARLIEHVAVWLERDHVDPGVRVVVRGDVSQRRRVLFDITHGGPVHRRTFDALPDICGDAHAVLSLAIALAIDAQVEDEVIATARDDARAEPTQLHAQVSLAYEVLPELALGADVGVTLPITAWLRLRSDLLALHSQDDTIEQSRGRFDATWLGGSAQLCAGGPIDPSVRFWLCVGGSGAWLFARGQGYAPSRDASAAWLGVRSGVRIEARAAVWWVLDVEVFSALSAPTFVTTADARVAYQRQSAPTGLLLSFGPALGL